MSYATQADMTAAFGEREVIALTDRAMGGTIDAVVLGNALDEATAEIDGYLAGRYAVPLATVPRPLVRICCDIARYHLIGADVTETDPARTRYRDALRVLEAVRDGRMSLGLDAASQPVASAGGVKVTGGTRTFSAGSLGDY